MAGIVLVIAVLLMATYRWTRFGLATRAASENEVAGMLAGLSPNQLSLVNTILASVVGGIVGMLAAPLFQVDSTSLPFQIVPALGAAVFAALHVVRDRSRGRDPDRERPVDARLGLDALLVPARPAAPRCRA